MIAQVVLVGIDDKVSGCCLADRYERTIISSLNIVAVDVGKRDEYYYNGGGRNLRCFKVRQS